LGAPAVYKFANDLPSRIFFSGPFEPNGNPLLFRSQIAEERIVFLNPLASETQKLIQSLEGFNVLSVFIGRLRGRRLSRPGIGLTTAPMRLSHAGIWNEAKKNDEQSSRTDFTLRCFNH
jgi:hypothetical protein